MTRQTKKQEPPPEPIALPAPVFGNAGGWQDVMEAAGWRCQCGGQCGKTHSRSGGRCEKVHGDYGGKGHPRIHLEAAPEDVTLTDRAAAMVPVDQLRAWCPPCRTAARREWQKATAPPPPADTLW